MSLLLRQFGKNGRRLISLGHARFADACLSPKCNHRLSMVRELSVDSRSAKPSVSQNSRLKSTPPSPPNKSQGDGSRVKFLLLGGATAVAFSALYISWPRISATFENFSKTNINYSKAENVNSIVHREEADRKLKHSEETEHSVTMKSKQSDDSSQANAGQEVNQFVGENEKEAKGEVHTENGNKDDSVNLLQESTENEPKIVITHENIVDNEVGTPEVASAPSDENKEYNKIKETGSSNANTIPFVGIEVDTKDNKKGNEEQNVANNNLEQESVLSSQNGVSGNERSTSSLADSYLLPNVYMPSPAVPPNLKKTERNITSEKKEGASIPVDELKERNVSKDDVILNLVEAIHAAEKRQADVDAAIFNEHKQKMKEKYEKELKDARARLVMYAEELDSLEKDFNSEKEKAAAAVKSLEAKAEERLKSELKKKEEEAEEKLKKAHLLGEAERAAAVANEKTSHLVDMADANIQINSLRMAFYARSEEARQSHSLHKLALGTFALQDALMNGEPLHKDVQVLRASLNGGEKVDDLINVVLSSLPSEVLRHGIMTKKQLHNKFELVKGAIRELTLIPSGGGGLVTHALARFAAALKLREDGSYHGGIESAIASVENLLIEGKLIEAANALEKEVQGSKAEALVTEWALQVRQRAVTEQALKMLEAYAITIASSLV